MPTLRERVYANRFNGRDKQITMLYNDGAFTVDGMLLPVEREEGWHWFELLRGEELSPHRARGGWAVGLVLGPNDVACIARLPERLRLERVATGYRFEVAGDFSGMKVQVCDREGAVLSEQDAARSDDLVMLERSDAEPAGVKLVRYGRLIDIVEIP